MIIKFLFNTMKVLIIWLIIGVTVSVAYKHIKPYYKNVIPALKRKTSSVQPTINELVGKTNFKEILDSAINNINELSDKISMVPKPAVVQESTKTVPKPAVVQEYTKTVPKPVVVQKTVAAFLPNNDIAKQKEEIIDRQLSILNDLMR
jgi:hypothetical protein